MQPQTRAYTGLTAIGALAGFATPAPMRSFALQVSTPSGVITSWSVALEGSLDGVNWTALITHAATIGSTQWAADKPVSLLRVNVTALTLGTAPSITATVVAVP